MDAIPLGRVSAVREEADRFSVIAVLARDQDHIELASVEWPKVSFDAWWRSVRDTVTAQIEEPQRAYRLPAVSADGAGSGPTASGGTDGWRPTAGMDFRQQALSVWTGSEMIVWGGFDDYSFSLIGPHRDGGRYDPATDTWRPISVIGAPSFRILGVTMPQPVWTGKEMIVWGGFDPISGDNFNDGARYDPATDTWTPMSTTGAPAPRDSFTTVWTGKEMIVWGGWNGHDEYAPWFLNTGGRYNPETDTWTPTSLSLAPEARQHHSAVWTGTRMIVWGGVGSGGPQGSNDLNNGGIYDPQTDSWSLTGTSLVGAPTDRYYQTAIWTGTEMIIWGGRGLSGATGSGGYDSAGGRYNPATDTWQPTSTVNVPGQRKWHVAVWTGTEMLIWGGDGPGPDNGNGGRYNPATDTWVAMNQNGQPPLSYWVAGVWTGSEMLVWGGTGRNDGRYNPATDTWRPMNTPVISRQYAGPYGHSVVWTGSEMIIWGGRSGLGTALQNTGGVYVPSTDTWRLTATVGAPDPRYSHTAVWTGGEMIVWGGTGGANTGNTGARYDPATNTWAVTSVTASTPSRRGVHTAVWTGSEMIVWGGRDGSTAYDSGGRYDPATDTWQPTSTTDAPSGRSSHSAVWSGSRMIVWGGGTSTATATGGRYDPATDTWQATSATGAPSARSSHTAIWTGSEMIVWGGGSSSGGRYDPAADSWQPMNASGDSGGVIGDTAIWTGSEMIVWGGGSSSGGRYDPAADTWQPTSIPRFLQGRTDHSAVWTGSSMIVFGGYPMTTTGAVYVLEQNLPPVPRVTANPTSGAAPLPVAFDASTSSDPDGGDTIASYTFDFGDGSAAVTQAGATASHTYTSAGTYTATVTVEDNHGSQSASAASVPIQVTVTPLSISGVSHSGPVVTITGALDVGTEVMKTVAVMADPEADDLDGGALTDDGLDLAGGSIGLDAAGNLVFTLSTYDMSPVLDAVAPTFVYDWYVSVDGVEMGYMLQAGFLGGFGEANTGKFFKLCRRSNGFSCPTSLTGTMGGNTVSVTVPPGLIGARPGSLIDVGTGNGAACPGICSTWQPVGAHQHNTGGDSAVPAGYMVPGGVKVGVAPAATPDGEVGYTTWASVGADGTWSADVTVEGITAGASYKAVAQTCSGLADTPVCATAVRVFTA